MATFPHFQNIETNRRPVGYASFFRVHNSFLVNLQYAIRYVKGEGGYLVLNNDMTVPVSRSKKEELLKLITHLSV